MSYEYNVPYVDFVTAFGENDDADKFFDINTELEKLSIKETPNEKNKEKAGRLALQEVTESTQNIEISQKLARQWQKSSQNFKSGKVVQQIVVNAVDKQSIQNVTTQVSLDVTIPKSTVKRKMHFQIIEEVNGELCTKSNEVKHVGVPRRIPCRLKKFVTQHSFEERQKLQMRKKEEKIKILLQEEQKKRVFHANPVPNYLKLNKQKQTSIKTTASSLQNRTRKISSQVHPTNVICKQSAVQNKTSHVVKSANVVLHSERRAKKREEFEEKLKQRCIEMEKNAKVRRELQLQHEREEIANLRKKLVHKARPVPVYKTAHKQKNSIPVRRKNVKTCDQSKK